MSTNLHVQPWPTRVFQGYTHTHTSIFYSNMDSILLSFTCLDFKIFRRWFNQQPHNDTQLQYDANSGLHKVVLMSLAGEEKRTSNMIFCCYFNSLLPWYETLTKNIAALVKFKMHQFNLGKLPATTPCIISARFWPFCEAFCVWLSILKRPVET